RRAEARARLAGPNREAIVRRRQPRGSARVTGHQRAQVLADDGTVLERVARPAAGDPGIAEPRVPVDHEVRVGRDLVEAGPGLEHGLVAEPWKALALDGSRRLDGRLGHLASRLVGPL